MMVLRIRFRALPAIIAAAGMLALSPWCRASTVSAVASVLSTTPPSATDYVSVQPDSANGTIFFAAMPSPTSGNTLDLSTPGQRAVAGYLPCGSVGSCGVFIGGIVTNDFTKIAVSSQIFLAGASGASGNIVVSMLVPFTYTVTSVGGVSLLSLSAFVQGGGAANTLTMLTQVCTACQDTKSVNLTIPYALDQTGKATLLYSASEELLGEQIDTLDPSTFSISVPAGVSFSSALFPLAAVPEPGTAVLLLCGLLAGSSVVLRRHRFRSRSS
jgi:hypothetical protein